MRGDVFDTESKGVSPNHHTFTEPLALQLASDMLKNQDAALPCTLEYA